MKSNDLIQQMREETIFSIVGFNFVQSDKTSSFRILKLHKVYLGYQNLNIYPAAKETRKIVTCKLIGK